MDLFESVTRFSPNKIKWIIASMAGLFFIPFLGYVHLFDWDEINFAEISREMMVLGNYTSVHINYLPFWEKPPLFFWLQTASMSLFGINEFAARFPNALCGMITLPVLFQIGTRLYDRKFGLIWALAYFGSILPAFYFQSGIIDPFFNLFIFLGLYFFIQYYWKFKEFESIILKRSTLHYLFLAGLFSGLAILTKGPAGFLILLLCYGVYLVIKRFNIYVSIPQFLLYTLITISVALIWFGLETLINGPWFVSEFIDYNFRLAKTQDAGHGGFPGYHFVVIFLGCFPASLFSLRAFKKLDYENEFQKDFKIWMMILLWVILILFSIVQSKIVHYSSMAYFPVTYLSALVIYKMIDGKLTFQPWIGIFIKTSALIIGALMVLVPYLGTHPEIIRPLTSDAFVLGALDAEAGWTGFETMTGFLLIAFAFTSVSLFKRKQFAIGIFVLFAGTALTIKLANVLFTKKIEAYTQRAAVDFFESVQDEDAYLHPVGFKTYIHYFYGKVMPSQKPVVHDWANQEEKQAWQEWLMTGKIDKPVYFVTKIDKTYRFKEVPDLDSLYTRNGYVFYKRSPSK